MVEKGFIVKKIIFSVLTLFSVISVNFVLFRVMPGDPAKLLFRMERTGHEEAFEAVRRRFGLDKPLWMQYFIYIIETFRGNLSLSYKYNRPVVDLILERLPNTLLLTGSAALLGILVGVLLGAVAGWKRGTKVDFVLLGSSLIINFVPVFWLGTMLLLVFGYWFKLFPLGGIATPIAGYTGFEHVIDVLRHLILPMVSLMTGYVGGHIMLMRGTMLDVLVEDYMVTANAKGLKKSNILINHALRNALLPTVTTIALELGFLVSGAIVTETVFTWPGVGYQVWDAVRNRDYPLLQGTFLILSISVVVANFVVDMIYGYLDPRISVKATAFDGAGITKRSWKTQSVLSLFKKLKEFSRSFRSHNMGVSGLIVIIVFISMALFAPYFSTHNPKKSHSKDVLVPPSSKFLIGTDNVGRDIFSQLIYGSRISIMIGILAAAISAIIGSIIGLLSGYYGGRIDEILMRIVDAIMVLPRLAIMIVLAAILGPSVWNIILVIGVLGWVYTARVVRAQVLSVKERPFVEAARCIGASNFSIMFSEILPNVFPIIFVQTTLGIGWAIYSEATLSFLGLGDPTVITWGQMLHFCWQSGVMSYAWWWAVPPGLTITFLILGFSFLGSGLNEVLNPRYRLR